MPATNLINDQLCEEICSAITTQNALGNLQQVVPTETQKGERHIKYLLQGEVELDGRTITLEVGFKSAFPLELPIIFIKPWNALGFIPHIEPDGYICFATSEAIVLDRENPVAIVEHCIQSAIRVLENGLNERNHNDFMEEFGGYWRHIEGVETVNSFMTLDDAVRRIIITRSKEKFEFVSDDEQSITKYHNGYETEQLTIQRGIYIALECDAFIKPPEYGTMWSLSEIREIVLSNISAKKRKQLLKLIRKKMPKQREFLILKITAPSGRMHLIGIEFVHCQKAHPLAEYGEVEHIVPLQFVRGDLEYLLERSGSNIALAEKKVLLIGCGSIGGYISLELARSGILTIALVDPEKLTQDNAYRHVLGRETYGSKGKESHKVVALKREIEMKLPYVQVEAISKRVESLLKDEQFAFSDFDLVVVALGIPTLELYLNEIIQRSDAPPTVFTWLEPYGIGGHALLTNNGQQAGCMECLYNEYLYNRSSFAAPDQKFVRDLLGCGTTFTPYGSLDAMRTAEHASRLCLNVLEGQEPDNPLLSWKGEKTKFEEAGFMLSSRFDQKEEELLQNRYAYKKSDCHICSSRSHGE